MRNQSGRKPGYQSPSRARRLFVGNESGIDAMLDLATVVNTGAFGKIAGALQGCGHDNTPVVWRRG
ncbi:hypothetical protein [Amycolatopsis sp. WAC 01375]|uniref:hypothetical protein n=1 Tax=Amycolatopsis sp. WAC 01375 TaxID=2203194 RepID=UPI000F793F94|nr:hypothetical protein [Amycolatopsis sp. WAC 01375]